VEVEAGAPLETHYTRYPLHIMNPQMIEEIEIITRITIVVIRERRMRGTTRVRAKGVIE
jgi:hypothetical protein